jgi:hypothetical protein
VEQEGASTCSQDAVTGPYPRPHVISLTMSPLSFTEINQSHINRKFRSSVTSSCGRWITVPKNWQHHRDNRLKSHGTHRCKIKVYQLTSRSLKATSPSQFAGHMVQVSRKKWSTDHIVTSSSVITWFSEVLTRFFFFFSNCLQFCD